MNSQVLQFFTGVRSIDAVGYEARPGQREATASLRKGQAMQRMRIAIIGLGRMGRALADRFLDEGHDLGVWNRTQDITALVEYRWRAE